MSSVITANRLTDGLVVFLDSEFRWIGRIADAKILSDADFDAALRHAREDEARQLIVEPYRVDVTGPGPDIVPKALREAIRAKGPTVRLDLNIGS